jgi:aerobic carbon-monoxide dehydrogenase medium subunit
MPDSRASVATPESVTEAARLLATVENSAPLAGGTWIMRRNGERPTSLYVSLQGIPALREIELGASPRFGACVTHSSLASALGDADELAGLRDAAGRSANPSVRNMATIGGGLATAGFPSSDLVPALLALGAVVETDGGDVAPLETFLAARATRPTLITAVVVPTRPARSAHVRLLLRAGGEYPVAIVSVVDAGDGSVRVAIGSVTRVPFRWTALEERVSADDSPATAAAAARDLLPALAPRDDVDAPGWYRAEVLPTLLERAVKKLQEARQA